LHDPFRRKFGMRGSFHKNICKRFRILRRDQTAASFDFTFRFQCAHLDTATIMKARGNSSFSSAPETRTMFKNQNYAKRAGARTDTGPDGGGGLG
jgi:hypothetical protein